MKSQETETEVARMQGRVAALEDALARRSQELRSLQQYLCARDLAILNRLAQGETPYPSAPGGAFDPLLWHDEPGLVPADVEEALAALWRSLHSAGDPAEREPSG